jgi:hypothetical protein
MKFTFLCVLVNKQSNEKYILSLSMGLVKVGGYDFPTHVMAPGNSRLFFKRLLADIEFDMPPVH